MDIWRGQYKDDRLVQESFGVNEYLVEVKVSLYKILFHDKAA